jgi:PAS domain S-box-containing protein
MEHSRFFGSSGRATRPGPWLVRWLVAVACLLATGAAFAAGPKIRVGVERNSPPLSFTNAQEQPDGFTAELLREMTVAGGLEFEVVPNFWANLTADFAAGRLDALANVSITAERRATMDFSISHAYVRALAYTRPGAPPIRATAQFAGKTMATLSGSFVHPHAVERGGWGARVVRYDSWREMLEAVKRGECDFALVMRRLKLEQPDELGLNRDFVEDVIFPFHFAVHRGDAATLERINEALATVRQNGAFDRLYAKWIGPIEPRPIRLNDLRPYALPAALVVAVIAALFAWQQRVQRRISRQSAALRASEEKYRVLVDHADEAIYVVQDARFVFVNQTTLRLTSLPESALIGQSPYLLLRPQDRADALDHHRRLLAGKTESRRRDYPLVLPSGRELWISVSGVGIEWQGRPASLNFATDITASRQAELARREAAERLEKIANHLPGFVYQFRLRPDGAMSFPYASEGIEDIYRVRPADVRADARPAFAHDHPDDAGTILDSMQQSGRDLTPWRHEFRVRYPDGEVRWLEGNAAPQREPDGGVLWHGFISDISERKRTDQLIRDSLHEKEALLKEVHHRVKNNLQVITSLLRLEAGRIDEPATRAVLKNMQARIRAMALLHESLYRSENFARVDLAGYLRQVATQLFRGQNSDLGAVRLTLDLAPASVGIDQAIPCGLVVNELMTNSLKHAFPAGRGGEVRVTLHTTAEGHIELRVCDDGIGLPADFVQRQGHSLGLQLVSDLVKQLQATFAIGPGACFTLRFVPRAPADHPETLRPPNVS